MPMEVRVGGSALLENQVVGGNWKTTKTPPIFQCFQQRDRDEVEDTVFDFSTKTPPTMIVVFPAVDLPGSCLLVIPIADLWSAWFWSGRGDVVKGKRQRWAVTCGGV
ncbi:hypothetical protein L6452_43720 [Arctium lappa]|uniref:Uncharacterized protein n=1 Tax=Arctium lappa TaxID=4217 RepID=A0ACB8XDU3_ARCLA|nr:hypothetical protein L6452_43720 [Arctium lappa]